jgi:uncharacterized protein
MARPVVHFEVVGRDGDKLRAYYSELFAWQFDDSPASAEGLSGLLGVPMSYGFVQPDAGIPGGVGGSERGADDYVTFYVEVPDVEAALTEAERLGGRRVSGPHEVPGMGLVIGHFRDPEDHLIGLAHLSS